MRISDWSSDVCSSDLDDAMEDFVEEKGGEEAVEAAPEDLMDDVVQPAVEAPDRLARVARQGGGSSPAVEEGASEAAPALDPESFHDSGYRQVKIGRAHV